VRAGLVRGSADPLRSLAKGGVPRAAGLSGTGARKRRKHPGIARIRDLADRRPNRQYANAHAGFRALAPSTPARLVNRGSAVRVRSPASHGTLVFAGVSCCRGRCESVKPALGATLGATRPVERQRRAPRAACRRTAHSIGRAALLLLRLLTPAEFRAPPSGSGFGGAFSLPDAFSNFRDVSRRTRTHFSWQGRGTCVRPERPCRALGSTSLRAYGGRVPCTTAHRHLMTA
jgi:hypothetical protein